MVAMLCCLPAADRVVWLRLHRYGLSFCNVACFGVISLKRGIYCGGLCERAVGVCTQLTGPPVSSRCRAALFACGRRLLPPRLQSRRDGRDFQSGRALVACVLPCGCTVFLKGSRAP